MAQAAVAPSLSMPPGPKGAFLLGSAHELMRDWPGFSARCARDYGDVVLYRFLQVPMCQVTHPDLIEQVLVRQASNFHKSKDYAALKFIMGNGLLTAGGPAWQAQRQLMQPAFRHESISAYAEIMSSSAESFLSRWKDGEIRDIHEDMAELTLDVVARSLFGSKISHDARSVGSDVGAVMARFFQQAALSFILPDGTPLPKGPRLLRSKRRLDAKIYAIIHERRSSPAPGNDLLQILLDAQDEAGSRMTDEQLRDEIMTLFLAGHETTANALTWTWFLLSQNPHVERALSAELDSVLVGAPPSLRDLPRLPYTEMVVKESMRLYPPAWGIGRRAIHDFELNGFRIPAGTNVFILQWLVHRDPRFFPDPLKFDPERWRDDPIRRGRLPRFAYFPFGGGPRVCIGAGFAMMEATLLLATLAQRFRLELPPNTRVTPHFSITLRPKHGLKMRLHRRVRSDQTQN